MADPTRFDFDLQELTTALIKHQNLHDGLWIAGFEFGFGAMHVGPSPNDVKPAAFVQVNKVVLVRPPEGMQENANLIVDASKVNPPLVKTKPAVAKPTKR